MGPYCRYCGQRCFVYFPQETPQQALDAYGTSTIIATCRGGRQFERDVTGWDHAMIWRTIRRMQRAKERAGR